MTRVAKQARCRLCNAWIIWIQARHTACDGKGCEKCNERGTTKVPLDASAPVFGIPEGSSFDDPFGVLPPAAERRWFVSHFSTCPRLRQSKEPYGELRDV